QPQVVFAGQMTGVEGYMESGVSGLMAGINAARRLQGKSPIVLPEVTMTGALCRHVAQSATNNFQPMGANFGVLPPLEEHIRDKKLRYAALSQRPLEALQICLPDL